MGEQRDHTRSGLRMPSSGLWLILSFMGISWLIHMISLLLLSSEYHNYFPENPPQKPTLVRITFQKPSAEAKKAEQKDDQNREKEKPTKQIAEVIQKKTTKAPDPKQARLGYQTHQTEKETRVKKISRARTPGPSSKQTVTAPQQQQIARKKTPRQNKQPEKTLAAKNQKSHKSLLKSGLKISETGAGLQLHSGKDAKEQNNYERLLGNSLPVMAEEVAAGYQDYIDDSIEAGQVLDLNTQEYRYIGYFTSLRKAIELAWVYPSNAVRKRLYGNVFLKFTINHDGKVSKIMVLDSSGHKILDSAIMEAVRMAAPFAPLPHSFGKKINIRGMFRYVLN
ncbi:MAG: energy transducer TonB [Deltaproteobacteria bacterium]|nr:energy transducer TonB [Deltaproteobacteria bacterium]